MRVVSLQTLKVFGVLYPDALQPWLAWYDEVASANWTQPADIKARYASASILKNRRVVFNIRGNRYRLIVAVAYQLGVVYIKFVGTHEQYDLVDAETIEMN